MNVNMNEVKNASLFEGIEEHDIESLMTCMSAEKKTYKKGQLIIAEGDTATSVGSVLTGKVHIIKEDFWGNRSIISEFGAGQTFGETYAVASKEPMEVSVVAAESCEILYIDVKKIMMTCTAACAFHVMLIRNLLTVAAKKNVMLTKKLEHTSYRTTREKLLSYLSEESHRNNSSSFIISFNRQQLADYLFVDRSALSKELCRLRDEGILSFNKNNFRLLKYPDDQKM